MDTAETAEGVVQFFMVQMWSSFVSFGFEEKGCWVHRHSVLDFLGRESVEEFGIVMSMHIDVMCEVEKSVI